VVRSRLVPVACRLGVHVSTESNQAERRILRRADVEARCGFKRAHLYKLISDGKFPRPLRIGIRAVGWDSVEVDQWIADQLQRRRSLA
jgi:prophage regulatory protein